MATQSQATSSLYGKVFGTPKNKVEQIVRDAQVNAASKNVSGGITINNNTSKRSGRGGGGSGGNSSGFSSANPILNTNPNFPSVNPQASSQAQQDASMNLARQNAEAQNNANQRDVSYSLSTQTKVNPYSSYATSKGYSGGTQLSSGPGYNYQGEIFFASSIYSTQVDSYKNKETGQRVSIKEIRYNAGATGSTGLIEDRLATNEEQQTYFKNTMSIQPGTKATTLGVLKTGAVMYGSRAEQVLEPVVITSQKTEDFLVDFNKGFTKTAFNNSPTMNKLAEFGSGNIRGLIPSTTGEVVVTGVSFGVGSLVGGGARIGGATLSKFAPSTVSTVSKGLGVGGVAFGGFYGLTKVNEMELAPTIEKKGEVFGGTVRELGAFDLGFRSGSKAAGLGVGLYRTRGMSELEPESIIAPEYLKGQLYPTVKSGQTAGELLSEFKIKLPGETKPAGWTSAPRELTGTQFQKGSSELPAFYQSPDLNPQFAGLGKGSYGLNLDILPGGMPTVFRTTPTSYELTPFVKPGQSRMASLKSTKEFFLEGAEKGKSYVTFIKTEKESLIPFDTSFKEINRRYYVKLKGERVPIVELETLPGGKTSGGEFKVSDITSSYRSSSKGSSYFKSLSPPSSSSSSYSSLSSNFKYSSGFNYKSLSNSLSINPSRTNYYGKFNSFGGDSSSGGTSGFSGTSFSSSTINGPSPVGSYYLPKSKKLYFPVGSNDLFGTDVKKYREKKKPFEVNIAPSFTAIIKEIKMTSPLKVSKTFGVTPFQTRGLLVGKASSKKYYQLTDL